MDDRETNGSGIGQARERESDGVRIVFSELIAYAVYAALLAVAAAAAPPGYRGWVIAGGALLWLAAGVFLLVRRARSRPRRGHRGPAAP